MVDTRFAQGLQNAAEALVQSLGAGCVSLQVPSPPAADDDGEELGLRSPSFQVQQIGPAAIRRSSAGVRIDVSAPVLEDVLGVSGEGAVNAAFVAGTRVQIGDEFFALKEVQAVQAAGCICLYSLLLQQQTATEVV